jgi:hypothetical protein
LNGKKGPFRKLPRQELRCSLALNFVIAKRSKHKKRKKERKKEKKERKKKKKRKKRKKR